MGTSSRMTSRRAKNIENRLLKQIIVVGILTIGIAAAFIFVVIPNVIKFVSGPGSVNQVTEDTSLPPQTPFIAAPVDATNSAQLTLSGYSQKGNQIVILINGSEVKRADAGEDGSFSAQFDLQNGDNSITAYAVNTNQKESGVSQAYLVKFDNEPPKLDITDPQDNATVIGSKNQRYTIKGTTDQNTRVTLNDSIIFVKSDGTFTSTFQLSPGENTLTFKATDAGGNTTEKKVLVKFSP